MSQKLTVTLERGPHGLGFNIKGGVDEPRNKGETGIYISMIKEHGAAAADGQLQVGDLIVEVNGKRLKGFTHNEAAELFQTAGDSVTITVLRHLEKPNYSRLIVPVIGLLAATVIVAVVIRKYRRS